MIFLVMDYIKANNISRAFCLSSKHAQPKWPPQLLWVLQSALCPDLRRSRKTSIPVTLFMSLTYFDSAMANVPISGALAEKYGYLSLSLFSGVSLILGGLLLILSRLAQNRDIFAIV